MFYSHEVLTSRKYGVATVWLVATLGSKSNSKKINRKAIQDVNVPKACQTIIDPAAPMALRLQGNLLYGVSRVYVQQCGYVLADAQNAYNAMHLMLRAIENAALDPQAGKARPDQLVMPDDPSFLPEFAMPPPELLAELHLGRALSPLCVSGESQSLTPFADQQDPSTPAPAAGLILPTSSSVGPGGFDLQGNGPSSIGGHGDFADEEMIDAPDFTFDENGEFVDLTEANMVHGTPAAQGGSNMHSDAGASAKVRQEHEDGLHDRIEQPGDQMDLDLPMLGNDLPEGEAFPTGPGDQQDQLSEVVESSDTAVAPNRPKKRAACVLPVDTTLELRNKDLADWNANYLVNMKEASKAKHQYRSTQMAKKNAQYWLWSSGLGGLAARMRGFTNPTPFDTFIYDNFPELVIGGSGTRSKRDRDSGIDEATQEESRRVRQKTDEPEEELARGQDDEVIPGGDDIELPREEQPALDDQQRFSDMPWNITASVRGSSAVPRSGRVGLIGSAPPSSIAGRGRMVSESPLHRRSQPGGLDALQYLEEDGGDFGDLGGDDYVGFADPGISSDMPDAAPTEPHARVQEALSTEGGNFLSFIADAIDEKRDRIQQGLELMSDVLQADAASAIDEISFDDLLPPNENNRVVASQALMMTLTLGTKGLLDVQQEDHFGNINLSLTDKGKVKQTEMLFQVGNQEDVVEQELELEEAGQFEEQFAGGRMGSDDADERSVHDN